MLYYDTISAVNSRQKLGVSKTSASRSFDEIEYLNVTILDTKGKSRAITIPTDIKQLWEQIQHLLRNPVIRKYVFPSDIHLEKKPALLLYVSIHCCQIMIILPMG